MRYYRESFSEACRDRYRYRYRYRYRERNRAIASPGNFNDSKFASLS